MPRPVPVDRPPLKPSFGVESTQEGEAPVIGRPAGVAAKDASGWAPKLSAAASLAAYITRALAVPDVAKRGEGGDSEKWPRAGVQCKVFWRR